MKSKFALLCLIPIFLVSSCDLINLDNSKKDTTNEQAGRVVLNFFFENVYWQYVYENGNVITGNGGHKGNFDSSYGNSEQKTVGGKKVITASIDRVFMGDTIVAHLEIKFDDTERIIKELNFDKEVRNKKIEKWNNKFTDIILVDENDTKKIFRVTGTDVCANTATNIYEYKTNTSGGYTKSIIQSGKDLAGNDLDWNKQCTDSDASKIEVEIYKN